MPARVAKVKGYDQTADCTAEGSVLLTVGWVSASMMKIAVLHDHGPPARWAYRRQAGPSGLVGMRGTLPGVETPGSSNSAPSERRRS